MLQAVTANFRPSFLCACRWDSARSQNQLDHTPSSKLTSPAGPGRYMASMDRQHSDMPVPTTNSSAGRDVSWGSWKHNTGRGSWGDRDRAHDVSSNGGGENGAMHQEDDTGGNRHAATGSQTGQQRWHNPAWSSESKSSDLRWPDVNSSAAPFSVPPPPPPLQRYSSLPGATAAAPAERPGALGHADHYHGRQSAGDGDDDWHARKHKPDAAWSDTARHSFDNGHRSAEAMHYARSNGTQVNGNGITVGVGAQHLGRGGSWSASGGRDATLAPNVKQQQPQQQALERQDSSARHRYSIRPQGHVSLPPGFGPA